MALKRRLVWIGTVLLLVAAGIAAWQWHTGTLTVQVATARTGTAADLVYATGYVEAQQPVSIAARITAPVERVLVAEGERVTRGQPLVLLSTNEQRGLLAQAEAQRRAAEEKERRTLVLARQGWVTRAARDQAVADADAARAAVKVAHARLDQYVVRANTDGVVIKRDVEPGDLATPSRVLMLLGDPRRIRITATVDERDIARVHVGEAALMSSDAWPGRVIHGHVSEITPGGDPTARAFRVRLLPDDGGELPLGITLEINIVARSIPKAVLVPPSAVSSGRAWVIEDGRAQKREVRTGIAASEAVQVVSGLKPGETVILSPPEDLAEGRKVKAAK